jgi:hypothetical protein
MPAPTETFERIIRQQTAQQLVPFLLGLGKKDIVPVRQKTLSLKKELEEYKQYEVKPGQQQWTCLLTPEPGPTHQNSGAAARLFSPAQVRSCAR